MKIDEKYSIEKLTHSFMLIEQVESVRKKDSKDRWKEGDLYFTEETYYYGTLKQALMGYLKHSIGHAPEISDIVDQINESERKIESFLFLVKV